MKEIEMKYSAHIQELEVMPTAAVEIIDTLGNGLCPVCDCAFLGTFVPPAMGDVSTFRCPECNVLFTVEASKA